jgi:1,4-dihydroxy-2-naphthoate octaprenyltransferase
MVAGAAIVAGDITGHELSITCAALLAFFMVNNLLLANQFPDIKADAEHGREHLLIKYGAAAGVKAYVITTLLAGLTILIATILDVWTPWVLLALLPWSLTLKTWMALNSLKENIAQQPEALGLNVVATLLTPLVVSVALLVAP